MNIEQAKQILKENNLPENFCILPFMALEAKTTGLASICCVQQGEDGVARKQDGTPYQFETSTIEEVFNSQWVKDLRQQFLNNEQVKSCYNCWDEERAGLASKRIREIIRFQDKISTVVETPHLTYLDLKFGNICNLKCRICTSFASSKWAEDEIKSGLGYKEHAMKMIELGKWPKDNQKFWNNLYEISNQVDTFEFFGGEPMLLKEHTGYLKKLVELGGTENKVISYNTNGTQDMKQFYDLWNKFKRVQVFFSIDGIGDRFTYLRHPANWSEVNKNINNLIIQGPKNVEVSFFCSVSAFNVWYLDEVAEWADSYPNIHLHWNMVYTPSYYSAKCLPADAKKVIKDKLLSSKYSNYFENIIKYIDDSDYSKDFPRFLEYLEKIDAIRNENFKSTFSEYSKIIYGL